MAANNGCLVKAPPIIDHAINEEKASFSFSGSIFVGANSLVGSKVGASGAFCFPTASMIG